MNKKHRWIAALIMCVLLLCISTYASAEEDRVRLHIMHFYGETETDYTVICLRKIIDEELPEVFPNVELVEEVCDNETYKVKLRVLMACDELPDIMFSYGGGFSEPFFETGHVLALDDYLDDFYKERLVDENQKYFTYDGKLYGLCSTRWTGVLYCNTALFERAGVEIPETYDELLEVCAALRQNGIQPIACGMVNYWMGQQWINNYTLQLGGAELYQQMLDDEVSLNNEMLKKAAEYVLTLINAKAFCDEMNYIDSSEAEEIFLKEQAAMIYIGDWFTRTAEERLGNKVAVAKMPQLPDVAYPEDYHGGAVNGWIVSADTQYPELATQVVSYLAYRVSCYLPAISTFKLEANEYLNQPDALEQKIMKFYPEGAVGGAAWDTIMLPEEASTWLKLCGRLFTHRCNGAGFALQVGAIR